MNLLDINISTITPHFGFEPKTRLIDQDICVDTPLGLAAMHFHSGSLEDLTWAFDCLAGLRERGIKGCSQLIRTLAGNVAVKSGDNYVFFTEYVPGTSCDGGNTFEVRAIGRLLGEIHAASEDILYFFPAPKTRQAPPWLQGAKERTAYWKLASHKYRQAARGEALRLLLRDAQSSIARYEQLLLQGERVQVLSFERLSFSKFVYITSTHQVQLNSTHECGEDSLIVGIADMLLDLHLNGTSALHFLAAYQAVRPLTRIEIQLLLAYLAYPHEWARGLDDLTRGRPTLRASGVLEQVERKREWLEWLAERLLTSTIHEEEESLDMDTKKKVPQVVEEEQVPESVQSEEVLESVEIEPEPAVEGESVEESDTSKVEPEPVGKEEEPASIVQKVLPEASIVWRPFPRALGSKQEIKSVEEEQLPE